MERHNVFRSDRIKVTERLIAQVPFSSVLEIGAGDYSFDYVAKGENVRWIKVDFSAPADMVCDLNIPNLTLPLDDNSFDLIIITEVLEHLLWPQALLAECRRLVKPGGRLLVSVPNIASLSYRLAWLLGRIPSCAASANIPPELGSTTYRLSNGSLTGGHVIDFNLDRLSRLLDYAGFNIIVTKSCGIIWHRQLLPHWCVPTTLSSNLICIAGKAHVP